MSWVPSTLREIHIIRPVWLHFAYEIQVLMFCTDMSTLLL